MESVLIITSTEDIASMNIREELLDSGSSLFKKTSKKWEGNSIYLMKKELSGFKVFLGLTDERLIFLDNLKSGEINPDCYIFVSRHVSKAARSSLLIHTTGNWDQSSDFGGLPKDLSKASALLLSAGFHSIKENVTKSQLSGFPVDMEVTHHGPTNLDKPLVYMELGSTKQDWVNSEAVKVIASSILDTIPKYVHLKSQNCKIGVGFGGTHYAPNFSRILLNQKVALSFICPKYYILDLDEKMIKLMIANTLEKVDYFIVDWKGINSKGKQYLIPLLEDFDIPVRKTKDFK